MNQSQQGISNHVMVTYKVHGIFGRTSLRLARLRVAARVRYTASDFTCAFLPHTIHKLGLPAAFGKVLDDIPMTIIPSNNSTVHIAVLFLSVVPYLIYIIDTHIDR